MNEVFYIGCHLSAAEGFRGLARDALAIGANVFQFFTRNPRGGSAKAIDPEDVRSFLETSGRDDAWMVYFRKWQLQKQRNTCCRLVTER